jgi:hypothetical protein
MNIYNHPCFDVLSLYAMSLFNALIYAINRFRQYENLALFYKELAPLCKLSEHQFYAARSPCTQCYILAVN